MFDLRRLGLSLALLPTLAACPTPAPDRPARPRPQPSTPTTTTTTTPAVAAVAPTGPVELRGGTTWPWRVDVDVDDQAARTRALTLAPTLQAIVTEVERQLDPGRADGELGRFNRARVRRPLPVSGPALGIVEAALALGQRTDGAFDVTAGPLRAAWSDPATPPDPTTLETARARTGLQRVRPQKGMLLKDVVDLELDASALIDSVAVDGIVAALRERGFSSFVVEVGGAAIVVGRSRPTSVSLPVAGSAPHVVGVGDVAGAARAVAVATAPPPPGTIDPRSGRPVAHDLAACVVIANDVVVADGLAEACLVVGPDGIAKTLRAFPGAEAQWQRRDGERGATPGFPR